MKSTFLEQQRDIPVYLRGLSQDPYLVIRKVLEVCWVVLCSHPKVTWTAKIHLLKLHELAVAENVDGDHIPADLVAIFSLYVHGQDRAFVSEDVILVILMLIHLRAEEEGEHFMTKEPQG
ncbi:hypothetical protein EDD22DRAFT_911412 [Suillus occidentalis]|nr:hypothetical protein EDD22DRAFT_911412 [Suillus occidentalis]